MKGRSMVAAVLVTVVSTLLSRPGVAELQLASPLGDGAVIQRDIAFPISGTTAPATRVAVDLGGRTLTATADAEGRFRVVLPPMPAGGPLELTIDAGDERLNLRDVMVGDVWVCSGQSNMEWAVAYSMNAADEIAAARDPKIRHLKVPRSWAAEPEPFLAGGAWEPADPAHVGEFTAVGYFFARELRRALDVPVGLINTSWGGSRIEPWMSAASLGLSAADAERILAAERGYEQQVLARIRTRIGELPTQDKGLVEGRAVWADPSFDDSTWERIAVPARWEDAGFAGMDGIAWYRTSFELTAEEAQAGITIGLGAIDDSEITWVNGREAGRTERAWNRPRVYAVPSQVVRPGHNVVAVRVEDTGGGGGIWGDANLLYVETAGGRRPLAGTWRFRPGLVTVNLDFHKNQVPTVLHNAMVHPLLAYPIKGILWYQGESNTAPEDALAYRKLFPAMIRDWRAGWGRGDLPFLWVQLANYLPVAAEPQESGWAMLRESQLAALTLPGTAQAVAIDIGEADDIHPRNKQEVGRRLALAARNVAYGEDVVFSGPVYQRHEIKDGRVVIEFAHVGGGLVARDAPTGALKQFAIAGADRRFVWAEAAIRGDGVVVSSEKVPRPVAVRYAWADNPEGANLCNIEGLPASPFRTDGW
jgi:sialate O-acetylesterase